MTSIEEQIGAERALVLDSTMIVVASVHWTRATTMVLSDEASVLIEHSTALVRSPSLTMKRPLVVMLNSFVPNKVIEMSGDEIVSKRMIRERDDYTCKYCGKFGDTVDHIFPKSRGGKDTWGNLCCACRKCNGEKSDLTPKEAGLPTPVIPKVWVPRIQTKMQEHVYAELSA